MLLPEFLLSMRPPSQASAAVRGGLHPFAAAHGVHQPAAQALRQAQPRAQPAAAVNAKSGAGVEAEATVGYQTNHSVPQQRHAAEGMRLPQVNTARPSTRLQAEARSSRPSS